MKPRRDITLGEMQDECKKYWNKGNLGSCGKCEYMSVCCHYEYYTPAQLNLTDPPRFTEAQMALLKGWYINKAVNAGLVFSNLFGDVIVFRDASDHQIGNMQEPTLASAFKVHGYYIDAKLLDLAELLGKETNEKQ